MKIEYNEELEKWQVYFHGANFGEVRFLIPKLVPLPLL